jgi:hypothetical protein
MDKNPPAHLPSDYDLTANPTGGSRTLHGLGSAYAQGLAGNREERQAPCRPKRWKAPRRRLSSFVSGSYRIKGRRTGR